MKELEDASWLNALRELWRKVFTRALPGVSNSRKLYASKEGTRRTKGRHRKNQGVGFERKFNANGVEWKEDKYLMTQKYRGSIVVLSISKSVEPNEEQKEMISGFQQGILCKH